MQFIKRILKSVSSMDLQRKNANTGANLGVQKIRVGILGTGKIGTDLLVKIIRSEYLECVVFSGRNKDSTGMQYALSLGIAVSDEGINAFSRPEFHCDIVFDATTAAYHVHHDRIFSALGIFVVDMTPSQIGECCVPAISMQEVNAHRNISMISCGGQSSIPLAHVISKYIPQIQQIDVISTVSPHSIGPGTLANIAEYRCNTSAGLKKYTGLDCFNIQLLVDEVNPETKMRTCLLIQTNAKSDSDYVIEELQSALSVMIKKVNTYVPGYKLESVKVTDEGIVQVDVSVEGRGDFLPTYAGNLDIINCAAIAVAESYAKQLLGAPSFNYGPSQTASAPRVEVELAV